MRKELNIPADWIERNSGDTKAFFKPGYEKVLRGPWAVPTKYGIPQVNRNKPNQADYKKVNVNHVNTKVAGLHGSENIFIHSATRNHGIDIAALEFALKSGVKVEEPIAVIGGRERPLIIFKKIPGMTLLEYLDRENNPGKRKKAIEGAVEQLKKLHAIGMVHGDAHCGNFIVSRKGNVSAIDLHPDKYKETIDDFEWLMIDLHSRYAIKMELPRGMK